VIAQFHRRRLAAVLRSGLAAALFAAIPAMAQADAPPTPAEPVSTAKAAPAPEGQTAAPGPSPAGTSAPASPAALPAPDAGAPEAAPPAADGAVATPVSAPGAPATAEDKALDTRIQDAKADVIELNRDLLVLEEELLFPANTQVAIFVSMDVGTFFDLDSVQLRLDDQQVAAYLYTPAETAALHRGGVQRLYLGNLRAGPHELVAYFEGKGPHDRDYKRGRTLKFDKGTDPRYIELQIKDSTGALQPEFLVKVW
jgi:hypothetical protein